MKTARPDPVRRSAPLSFEAEVLARLERIETLLLTHRPAVDERHSERLAVLAESTKGRQFTSRELLADAEGDEPLKAMLDDALIQTPKELGRLLRRLERVPATGPFRLVRVDQCRDGLVWAVRVSRLSPPQNS